LLTVLLGGAAQSLNRFRKVHNPNAVLHTYSGASLIASSDAAERPP
jgi:hypothetical protein